MWPPPLSETPQEFEVKPRTDGKRIDAYLASRFSDYSRSVIQRVIDAEAVRVNGRPVKQYVGRGHAAEMAALLDEHERQQRQAARLKTLEEENARLKRLLADAMLVVLKDLPGKKW